MGSDPKAKRYAALKRWLWMGETVLTLGGFLVLLKTGGAVRLSGWVLKTLPHWPLQTAGYVGILALGITAITFPLDWYGSFRLEHRFGLSTERFAPWLLEYAKRLGVGAVLSLLLIEGLMALIRLDPERWWGWMALLWAGWSVFLTRVAPQWLIPLFYRQSPLKDASLKERLQALLSRCGAQVHDLLEVNLSRSTNKANACLCGLGRSRRILLSDTLLTNYPVEEVEVVVAHEAGHHRLHHLPLGIALSTAAMGLGCFLVHRLVKTWRVPLGIPRWDDPAVLMIVGLGLTLVNLLLMPVLHGLWRSLEAKADRFSLEQTQNPKAFIGTMRRLAEQNLAEVSPPKWVEWFFYDHPSIARRVAMAEAFERG